MRLLIGYDLGHTV